MFQGRAEWCKPVSQCRGPRTREKKPALGQGYSCALAQQGLVGGLPDKSCGPSHQTTALTPMLTFWPHLTLFAFHIKGSVEKRI